MLEKDQEPQTLLPGTIHLITGKGKEIQQKNAIRQLLSGNYFERKDPKPSSQRQVYQRLAMVLPSKIEPTLILSEMAKIKDEILDEKDQKAFLKNARIFLQEALIADGFDEKFKGLKDFLRDNPVFNAEKMQASSDPLVKALYDMIKGEETEALQNELYEEARLAAIVGTVLKRDSATGKEVRIDKRAEKRQQATDALEEAGDIDVNTYLSESLRGEGSESTLQEMAHQVAMDMMNINRALLMQIPPGEVLELRDPGKSPKAATLTALYNNIGARIVFDILNANDEAHQQRVFDFYLKLLDESYKMGDFHSAMAIFSGLNNSEIGALRYLRDTDGIYAQYNQILQPIGSYKYLRPKIKERGMDAVPFTGLYYNDLNFTSEITDAIGVDLDGGEQTEILNLEKYETISYISSDLKKRQENLNERSLVDFAPLTNILARTQNFTIDPDLAKSRLEEIFPTTDRRNPDKAKQKPFQSTSHTQRDSMRKMETAFTKRASKEGILEEKAEALFSVAASTEDIKKSKAEENQVLQLQPEEQDQILEKSIAGFKNIAKGFASHPAVMKEARRIVGALNGIREDGSLSPKEKLQKVQAFLTAILSNPNTDESIHQLVTTSLNAYLEKEMPPPIVRPPLPPSALEVKIGEAEDEVAKLDKYLATLSQEAMILEQLSKERAAEKAEKKQTVPLSSEDAAAISEVEVISKEAISQAASVSSVEKKAPLSKVDPIKVKGAFTELVKTEQTHRDQFFSIAQIDAALALVKNEKAKYSESPAAFRNFERMMQLAKELVAASNELSQMLDAFQGDPSRIPVDKAKDIEMAIVNYAKKMQAYSSLYYVYQSQKDEVVFANIKTQLDNLSVVNDKKVSFLSRAAVGFQRAQRVTMPIEAIVKYSDTAAPESLYWAKIARQLKRLSVEADTQLVTTSEVAKRVALNSPVWLIEADKPKRGQEPTNINVVRVLGDVAISREPMPMQTGFAYAYPVTTKVHGLSRFTGEPMFFAVMGPDQFLSKEGVTLKDETIGKLITHFQSTLQQSDTENIGAELKALKVNELFPSWKPDQGRSIGFEQIEAVFRKYHVNPSKEDIEAIGRFLQADLGSRHVAQVAEEIGIGEPKKYAALTIAGNKRSEASGFGIESGQILQERVVSHTTQLKDGSTVPTASVYVNHHPNISEQLVLQSGGQIEGNATTLTFHGLDLNHVVEFYLHNKEQGLPIVVNCTDGIDRTGMLVTALAMLNDYNENKQKDISLEDPVAQQKILVDLIESLRKDRGPFFLRGNEDIAIAVTLGFALIATQKQLDFQKSLKNQNNLSSQFCEVLENANQLEPKALQLLLDDIIDQLPAQETELAENWGKLVRARVSADNEYLKANKAGSYKSSFDKDFPRSNNMSDGVWAKSRKDISFGDFPALKQKGFDIEPYVSIALSNFIKKPTFLSLQSLSAYMENEAKKNQRSLDKAAKEIGIDPRIFEALSKIRKNEKISPLFSAITIDEKNQIIKQIKDMMQNSQDKKFQALCERVMNALPADALARKQETKAATQAPYLSSKAPSHSGVSAFFNIIGVKKEQMKDKTQGVESKASSKLKKEVNSATSKTSPVSRPKSVRFTDKQSDKLQTKSKGGEVKDQTMASPKSKKP